MDPSPTWRRLSFVPVVCTTAIANRSHFGEPISDHSARPSPTLVWKGACCARSSRYVHYYFIQPMSASCCATDPSQMTHVADGDHSMLTSFLTATILALGTLTAGSNETMTQSICCLKQSYCCSIKSSCCRRAATTEMTSEIQAVSGKETVLSPNCCLKRAYCCSIRRSCCGKTTPAQLVTTMQATNDLEAKQNCCLKRSYCCSIRGSCCRGRTSANAVVNDESMSKSTCCLKRAYCCSVKVDCCSRRASVTLTT